jgi:hypothetical protein
MSTQQLQQHACRECSRSCELQRRCHTFDYDWCERYARVYRLPTRIRAFGLPAH